MIIWTIINLVLGVVGWAFGNVLLAAVFYFPLKLVDKFQSQLFGTVLAVTMLACYGVFNVGYPIWAMYGSSCGISHVSRAHSSESDSD